MAAGGRRQGPGRPHLVLGRILAAGAIWGALQASPEALAAFLRPVRWAPLLRAGAGAATPWGDAAVVRRAEGEADLGQRIRVENLQPGQELNGIVNSIASFGCFVDVGADRDGLVHISQIKPGGGFVEDVASEVQPGQTVKVWVTGVAANGRLGLTMVRPKTDFSEFQGFAGVPPEQWLEGTVRSITDFGIFVTMDPPGGGPSAQGFVHISQMKDGFVEHPSMEVKLNQAVRVRVVEVDMQKGRLRCSMKEPQTGPTPQRADSQEVARFAAVAPSEWLTGRVHHTTRFGIFVDVVPPGGGEPVQGLVHITEIRDGFVDDPSAEVQDGQEVKVRVVNVDPGSGRVAFSMKPEKQPAGA